MGMTPKENILAVLNHEKGEWTPHYVTDMIGVGFGSGPGPAFEKGPLGGGSDAFGVNWVTPASGGGAPIPEPGKFQLDSDTITDWKKIVTFPDLAKFDWEAQAKAEFAMANGNRDTQAVDFGSGNGPFERLAALMGFEEALMAMALEPEATGDLLNAIGDYKIQVAEYVKKYYNPDSFTNYDDIATERGLFMSPETYRKLIKPVHTKMCKAIKDLGMIPIQHTCGKADIIVEDMIETGAAAWTSVQPTNDIEGILQKYGDRLAIMGGYDSNGAPGMPDTSLEIIEKEVHRCYETYGKYNSFIFFGFRVANSLNPKDSMEAMMPIIMAAVKQTEIIKSRQK